MIHISEWICLTGTRDQWRPPLNAAMKFLVQKRKTAGNLFYARRTMKYPCPDRWLLCYLLCSILRLERRTWEENIKMKRTEVEWECVGCTKQVHCTPCHEMCRTGQPDEIPGDHIYCCRCLCTQPRKYKQLRIFTTRGSLIYGVLITAIWTCDC